MHTVVLPRPCGLDFDCRFYLEPPTMATMRMGRAPRVHPVLPTLSSSLNYLSSRIARAATALALGVSRRRAAKVTDALIAAAVPMFLLLAMASPLFNDEKHSRHYW